MLYTLCDPIVFKFFKNEFLYNLKFLDRSVKYILRDNFMYPNPVFAHHTF